MKRIAIPIKEGRLSEYFGQCDFCQIFDINKGMVEETTAVFLGEENSELLPEWASSLGITDIVTNKIRKQIIGLFTSCKINLFVGIEIQSPEAIINDYLDGRLRSNQEIISEITKKQ
ncbi:MAG TPA: hypothetical protein DDX98_03425 [Bacteroidales bacterium]|jgi:predicted Fe-Mo cluster-binding NifX family protein|nr:hypothetical protein [Bacteroidales bacterium]